MGAEAKPASNDVVCDVAVVGAGPAGSVAALAAATSGASVVLLDRAEIPRYKTCGGGLIGTSRRLVSPYIDIPVRAKVRSATFTLNGSYSFTREVVDAPFLDMVYRDEFDAALVTAAQNAGAEMRQRTTVRHIDAKADRVIIGTTNGAVTAQVLIGADGSASRVASHVGVRYAQTDLGLELEVPLPITMRADWDEHMLIDWGPIPGSYGWVFPKGDTATVGVIATKGHGEPTRAYLNDFVRRLGLQAIRSLTQSGHLTQCRYEDSPLRRGRVIVVGDAAGLLEPWTREGISFAIRSGLAAGEAAAKASSKDAIAAASLELDAYERTVAEMLTPEMRAGFRILRAFARHPSLFHAVLATPKGWNAFIRICQGDTNLARVVRYRTVATALTVISSHPSWPGRK